MTAFDGVVQSPIRRPKSEQRNPALHQDALENMPVYVMPELVCQHGFNLIRGVAVEKSVGQNDAPRVTETS